MSVLVPPMIQTAPYPSVLADLVSQAKYRPGWKFALDHKDRGQGSEGLTLVITTLGYDTYHPDEGQHYRVNHYMLVPPAAYNERSWRMWLFEQILLVERHEAMEFFQIAGDRPYAPLHGPGNDPYLIAEVASLGDKHTNYLGETRQSGDLVQAEETPQ